MPTADEPVLVAARDAGMMRPTFSAIAAVVVLLGACGDSSLSLGEYVEQMQETADELQAMGEQVNEAAETAIDPETGLIVDVDAVGGIVADVASDLEIYYDDLEDLKPPSEIRNAHHAFVNVASTRLAQWKDAADRATELESVDDLVAATLKSSEFTAACMALEQAVDNNGLQLDLDCD